MLPISDILIRSISGYVFIVPVIILYFLYLKKSGRKQSFLHITSVFVFCYYLFGILTVTMCSADRENITTVKALLDEIENEALFNLLRSADKETLQIVFFRMLDIPTEQIAEKMGLTPNAIYLRINRLKEKIKKLKMGERK